MSHSLKLLKGVFWDCATPRHLFNNLLNRGTPYWEWQWQCSKVLPRFLDFRSVTCSGRPTDSCRRKSSSPTSETNNLPSLAIILFCYPLRVMSGAAVAPHGEFRSMFGVLGFLGAALGVGNNRRNITCREAKTRFFEEETQMKISKSRNRQTVLIGQN